MTVDPTEIRKDHPPSLHLCGTEWWHPAIGDERCLPDILAEELIASRRVMGKVTGLYLSLLMDQELEDGTPVLALVFQLDPDLERRFREALAGRKP